MRRVFTYQKAFTLIEMSVVIVIIGLLAGGIVLGQSFIRNAELNTMMSETKAYTSAFVRFQEQYNAVPGDMATASTVWPTATNGDGNSILRAGAVINNAEMFLAFQHLSLAGYIEGSYTGSGSSAVAGVNVPKSNISGVAYQFDHPTAADGGVSGDSYYFDGLYGHVLLVGGLSLSGSPIRPANGFVTPEEALAVDSKFDDGTPGGGSILAPKSTALANCTSSDVAASATYAATTSGKNCMFIIKFP